MERAKTLKDNERARWVPDTRLDGLVVGLAHKLAPTETVAEDLVQVGLLAAWEAEQSFDPGRGVKLTTYAFKAVRGAMLQELSASHLDAHASGVSKQMVARLQARRAGAGVSLAPGTARQLHYATSYGYSMDGGSGEDPRSAAQLTEACAEPSFEEDLVDRMRAEDLLDLAPLTERQRTVVQLCVMGDMDQEDVAGRLCVSQATVSREKDRALEAMRLTAGKEQAA